MGALSCMPWSDLFILPFPAPPVWSGLCVRTIGPMVIANADVDSDYSWSLGLAWLPAVDAAYLTAGLSTCYPSRLGPDLLQTFHLTEL